MNAKKKALPDHNSEAACAARRWAIPPGEIVKHKADIQRQAIGLYKCKDNIFAGNPRYERWRLCVRIVADCWMRLGPQADEARDSAVIYLENVE